MESAPTLNSTSSESENNSENPVAESPQAEAGNIKNPEKVFGREIMTQEDVKATAKEVGDLLKMGSEDNPDMSSAFQAARELAHMRRSKQTIKKEPMRTNAFNKLLSQRDSILKQNPVAGARYLTYLKFIGAIDNITEEESSAIQATIDKRTKGGQTKQDLSQICMNAKFLGIDLNYQAITPHLEQELEIAAGQKDNQDKLAHKLARTKYIGVSNDKISEISESNRGAVNSKLAEFRATGEWDKFAKLRQVINYHRGETEVDPTAQEEMVAHVDQMRQESTQDGKWTKFVIYIGGLTSLSARQGERQSVADEAVSETPNEDYAPDHVLSGSNPSKQAVAEDTAVGKASDTTVMEVSIPEETVKQPPMSIATHQMSKLDNRYNTRENIREAMSADKGKPVPATKEEIVSAMATKDQRPDKAVGIESDQPVFEEIIENKLTDEEFNEQMQAGLGEFKNDKPPLTKEEFAKEAPENTHSVVKPTFDEKYPQREDEDIKEYIDQSLERQKISSEGFLARLSRWWSSVRSPSIPRNDSPIKKNDEPLPRQDEPVNRQNELRKP